MICFNCKRQIPDNVTACPNCGAPVMHQAQVVKEVKFRRYQRWILYAVIVAVFLGMTAYAAKIYMDNSKLLDNITQVQNNLNKMQQELDAAKKTLGDKEGQLTQAQAEIGQLTESQQQLQQKTTEYQATIDQQSASLKGYEQFRTNLGADNANIFNFLVQSGIGTSNKDLAKIKLGDYNLALGTDTDKDGLSDDLEATLGTDKTKADTDGDKYDDKQELMSGYNPTGTNKAADDKFAAANAGKILIQIDGNKEAWYVSPKDLKRYYLGRPGEAVKALQTLK